MRRTARPQGVSPQLLSPPAADAASAELAAVAAKDTEKVSRSPVRVVITLFGTVLVVVLEFLFLMAIYYRGETSVQARLAVARLSGQAASTTVGPSVAALARSAADVAVTLRHSGVPTSQIEQLRAAAAAAAAEPTNQSALSRLEAAGQALDDTMSARQRSRNDQAEVAYAVLLFGASIGWMVWFRRLVGRHRALQREVTEQQARAVGEQRLAALIRNSSDLVLVCDEDSTVRFATQSAYHVMGIDADLLLGQRFIELVEPDLGDRFLRSMDDAKREKQALDTRLRHAGGHFISVEGNVTDLRDDPSVGGLVLTIRDVTERLQLQQQLSKQAFEDSLSGLANRQLFADRLSHALVLRSGMDQPLVVLLCDLDDFKNINDSLGHGVGDEVISIIGSRVRGVIRAGDTAARLGGDEFAILMEATDLASSQIVADRLLAVIGEPIVLASMPPGALPLSVRASIGLARAVPGEMTNADALRNADVAMYQAKNGGKARIAVYESRLHEEALDRLELRADLQDALASGEGLVLYFQPTVDLPTNEVVGYEALIRWQHPSRGFLPPGVFIPMAEQSGLIAPLGSWVLNEACRAAVKMIPPAGGSSTGRVPSIAINVAAEQLAKADFVEEVIAALDDAGLPSHRLTLEITEGVILDDLDAIAPRLVALRELGIRIAIDDFGTGYSSLAYLSHLPVDILKVDKSFVDRVTLDQQDASVTEAIIAMGRTMKMKIVAEGVEHPEQAGWLRGVNCDIGQGYVWSRPLPFEQARLLAGAVIAIPGMGESGSDDTAMADTGAQRPEDAAEVAVGR